MTAQENSSASRQANTAEGQSKIELDIAAMATMDEGSYESFLSIDEAKQGRIIAAAIELFSAQDYAQVSTNEIVKRAQISKGLLFHYFKSKAGLYIFLKHRVVSIIANTLLSEMDLTGGDVFDVIWKSTRIKLEILALHPREMQFYLRTFTDTSLPKEIQDSVQEDFSAAYGAMDQITNNLDESLLKDGLEKDMVSKIIYMVCESMSHKVLAEITPDVTEEYWQETIKELESYFAFMRKIFYQ